MFVEDAASGFARRFGGQASLDGLLERGDNRFRDAGFVDFGQGGARGDQRLDCGC